jgi:serine/threonine protein kinase
MNSRRGNIMIRLNIDNITTSEFTEDRIEIGRNKNILEKIEVLTNEESTINIFFRQGKAISRKHCEIIKQDSEWFLKDKNSTNGTFLNGNRVQEKTRLKDGDKVSLGKDTFIYIEIEDLDNTHFEGIEFEENTFLDEELISHTKTRLYIEEEDTIGTIELSYPTLLNREQYQIVKELGKSKDFTITYLAKDIRLDSYVVIKEYFPKTYANRDKDGQVIPTNQNGFNFGYEAFKEEAKIIANIPNHSNVIGIKNFFEENQTIYHVIDYIKGNTLANHLDRNYPLNQENIEMIINPLIEGIKHLHKHTILHKDINLSNILISDNGNPVLINLSISKEKIKRYPQNLHSFYTEAYQPIEQQKKEKEGRYTDIYALGMTIYALVNGIVDVKNLPSSNQRLAMLQSQGKSPLEFNNKKGFSKNFIKSIEKALEILPKDRVQTIEEFSKLFNKRKSGLFAWLF